MVLQDQAKGHNEIQDCFKDQEFVVLKQLHKPNVYQIRPVSGVSPEQVVNCRQLQDLQKAMIIMTTAVKDKCITCPPLTLR